jgi:hypothetical protein
LVAQTCVSRLAVGKLILVETAEVKSRRNINDLIMEIIRN